MPKQRK